MKLFSIAILFLLLNHLSVKSQPAEVDNLRKQLAEAKVDTTGIMLLNRLAGLYRFNKADSAMILIERALTLSHKLNFTRGEVRALNLYGEALRFQGDYPKALATEFDALRISRDSHDPEAEATSLAVMGSVYTQLNEYQQALSYYRQALQIDQRLEQTNILALSSIGDIYEKINQLDSATIYQEQAHSRIKMLTGNLPSLVMLRLGNLKVRLGETKAALSYYHSALANANFMDDLLNQGRIQYQLAELFYNLKQPDSSLVYARAAFNTCEKAVQRSWQLSSGNLLAKLYRNGNNLDSAYYYQQVATTLKDSLYGPDKFQRLQLLTSIEQQRQQEILQAQKDFRNKTRLYAVLGASGVFLFLAIIFYRNNRQKQKSNLELIRQKAEIQNTLTKLKATQAQLIQSEKMASLGELTAGIAHEIQNPLNFVNNFSEINNELIDELRRESSGMNRETASPVDHELLNDIYANNEKIVLHGRRADAIVKGMLEHSRQGTGEKQPADINALADEYLKLAYHGMRAKDKSFNVIMKTDFDSTIGKVNIIPQDIGRVLLNLYNNAFYEVSKKASTFKPQAAILSAGGTDYDPKVSVLTRKSGDKIIITVEDNGAGIPENIKDKIFQPFFTTKPTGHGTGLGLSLAYDIMKANGGEISVETKETEGSIFIIQLPVMPGES